MRVASAVAAIGCSAPICRMANSSPPSRATVSPSATQLAQPLADRLEQRVADGMAERIVDVLEAVEIEAEHRQALALPSALSSASLHALAQQHAVGQIGQHVVVRHVGDARLDAPLLGDVLVRGDPAAARHRLMLDGDDAPVA